ncbi:peptidase family M50-domain-containing protein [Polychytrium aggregatum]|uniref:peptidase family M50-domain-containing protein n=1 Tax=Polychytrium aggregatum TaxID=110093 RepID=UPI0022FE1055|nr:peptidase family M50-domain-containing protein [Polychytrium aggregatum]KAI9208910.1 peptidase family M50-domain-containing protein [Polychytrium aggregatum]
MAVASLVFVTLVFWALVRVMGLILARFYPQKFKELTDPVAPGSPALLPTSSSHGSARKRFHHLSIGHWSLSFSTNALNSALYKLVPDTPPWRAFHRLFYSAGAVFGLLSLFGSMAFLAANGISLLVVFAKLASPSADITAVQTLSPQDLEFRSNSSSSYSTRTYFAQSMAGGSNGFVSLIPGVNIHVSSLGYYVLALLVCGVVHELGHALAAIVERVPIESVGVFLYVIYPGAFVDLHQASLETKGPSQKLRVICAGVWHNVVLGLWVWLVLTTLPLWLSWGYKLSNSGVVVLDVTRDSPLRGHVPPAAMISQVNGRDASTVQDWEQLLYENLVDDTSIHQGYCVTASREDKGTLECCDVSEAHPFGRRPSSLQCFQELDATKTLMSPMQACLLAHNITENHPRCRSRSDCDMASGPMQCMSVYVPQPYVRLIRLSIRDRESTATLNPSSKDTSRTVTFLGDPREIWEGVRIGSLVPRARWLPICIPYMVEELLQFIMSFTFALAVFNMVPSHMLDGQHALVVIVDVIMDWIHGHVSGESLDVSGKSHVSFGRVDARKRSTVKWISNAATVLLSVTMLRSVLGAFGI